MVRTIALTAAIAVVIGSAPLHAQRLQLDAATEDLEQLVRADSNDATVHYNLALGYWRDGTYDRSETSLRQAIELEPRLAVAHLALAMLPYARDAELWEDAIRDRLSVERQAAIDASDQSYRMAFVLDPFLDLRIIAAVTPPKSGLLGGDTWLTDVYDTWLGGFDELLAGNYAGAFTRYDRLMDALQIGRARSENIPDWILWYHALAAAQIGKYDEAAADVEELLARREKEIEEEQDFIRVPLLTADYRYMLGVLQMKLGDDAAAEELLRAAATEDIAMFPAHVQLAQLYTRQNRPVEAVGAYTAAVAANPADATLQVDLALALVRVQGVDRAMSMLEEVIEAQPREARAYYALGLLRSLRGDVEGGRRLLEEFVAIAPHKYGREIADARQRLGGR